MHLFLVPSISFKLRCILAGVVWKFVLVAAFSNSMVIDGFSIIIHMFIAGQPAKAVNSLRSFSVY